MRAGDLLGEAYRALRGSRTRTLLTSSGIVVGSLTLTLILSLSLGLGDLVDQVVDRDEQLRQVVLMPGFGARATRGETPEVTGDMDEAKRERLSRTLQRRSRRGPSFQMRTTAITADVEAEVNALPQVQAVRPFLQDRFELTLRHGDEERELDRDVLSVGVPTTGSAFETRVLAGSWITSDAQEGALVHELLLYDLGLVSDAEQADAVGSTLVLTARERRPGPGLAEVLMGAPLGAQAGDRPELYTVEVPIVGVLREREAEEATSFVEEGWSMQTDVFLPIDYARTLWERTPGREGPRGLMLVARSTEDVAALERWGEEQGLRVTSVRQVVERIKTFLGGATLMAGMLAGIAVFVAGLGIVNTMVMSVVERTREIGLLKALGATDREVSALFLAEGALLGLLGGAVGVVLAFGLSLVGDSVGRSAMQAQAIPLSPDSHLFLFPWWLVLSGLAFAVGTSLLASLVPALRAARIDPVRALRHE